MWEGSGAVSYLNQVTADHLELYSFWILPTSWAVSGKVNLIKSILLDDLVVILYLHILVSLHIT